MVGDGTRVNLDDVAAQDALAVLGAGVDHRGAANLLVAVRLVDVPVQAGSFTHPRG
ncbi:hypothetical protein GF359_03910 [candidate division WOR-3 bacterium]|uniref:Uncharacterized protein n=1 Tax=candidate division WOR-3 bacterium TaxID=2052148 RepID=A0A9D5K8K5_UNCW3|nr:hypothetical protein [candidate division WOR-3 bacterium]MBD3364342.1 hypothetical protein [candidate division WOR-3 bacterium]